MKARRAAYGFFGGSFDPVQTAHLALARAARRERGLAKVYFVPAGNPPLKGRLAASAADRVRMLRLALKGDRRFPIGRWDLTGSGPSYTYATMARLRRRYPRRTWEVVVGGDSLKNFRRWRRWQDILSHHTLVVGRRPGSHSTAPAGKAVVFLKARLPAISATAVRRRAGQGKSLAGLVTPAVAAYIRRRGLYR